MENNRLTLCTLTTSLEKIFPETGVASSVTHGYAFADEAHSVQLALRAAPEAGRCLRVGVRAKADVPVEVYKVGFVPVAHKEAADAVEGNAVAPGSLYPDPLYRRPSAPVIDDAQTPWYTLRWEVGVHETLDLANDATTVLWITVNGESEVLSGGEHTLEIEIIELDGGTCIATVPYTLYVLSENLRENTHYYTNWFHYDCLADLYGTTVWSERFCELLPHWLKNAAKHGMTAILTPAFTPQLDIAIGRERTPIQLVGVTVTENGEYRFDFTRLAWFVKTAQDAGFRYFEHNHLFSQWGAKHAIPVYAETKDGYRRIFGVENDGACEEYQSFLKAYLTALMQFSQEHGIADRWVFHISDEPFGEQIAQYQRVSENIKPYFGACPQIDALAETDFATSGVVDVPVAEIKCADDFAKACRTDRVGEFDSAETKIPLWLYYTGGTPGAVNRLLYTEHVRVRILGVLMYRYGATGFLHWGYNYYYDRMSVGCYNPIADAEGYMRGPGSPYMVYPGLDGKPLPSIRENLMREAMQDYRALLRAEEILGRAHVMELLRAAFGFYPEINATYKAETLMHMREMLYEAVKHA